MAQIPADAQRSEDGQWWWDGSQWQPVGSPAGADAGAGGDASAATAAFAFDNNGLGIQADPADNPDNHNVPHRDAGNQAIFTVCNTGSAAGTATVTFEVDGQPTEATWTSGTIEAGQCDGANVSGLGRFGAGSHTFRAVVTPGAAGGSEATNTTDISDG